MMHPNDGGRAKAFRLADKRRYLDFEPDRPRKTIKKIERQIASDRAHLEDYRTLLGEARAKAPLAPGTPVVFLARRGDRITIGFSARSLGRIYKPKGAELLVVLQGDLELKAHLIERFGANRVEGEWFTDNAEIRAYIAERVEAGDNVSHRFWWGQ